MKWAAAAPSKALRGAGDGGGGAGQEYMVRVDVLVNFRKKAAAPSPSPDDADGAEVTNMPRRRPFPFVFSCVHLTLLTPTQAHPGVYLFVLDTDHSLSP